MANKILARTGTSLADVYDIAGSVAGVEILDSEEVKTVHEMGHTINSERMSGRLVVMTSGAIAQTTTWDATLAASVRPTFVTRVLGVQVMADTDRVLSCGVFIQDGGPGGSFAETPIWTWEDGVGGDVVKNIRTSLQESTRTLILMQQGAGTAGPNLLIGTDQPLPVGQIIFRGTSTTFGAGTVTIRAVIQLAFSELEGGSGLSSKGLPLAGW